MGHLFYTELGNQAVSGLSNTGDFQNLQRTFYWSSTTFLAPPSDYHAWGFHLDDNSQFTVSITGHVGGSLAVYDGDVTIVPEPLSSILFFTGGATLIGRRYVTRKKVEV